MSFLAGLLPKFLVDFFARVFKDWRRDRALEDKGRTERDLEVQTETVEVISRNQEGQQAVDGMTEEELDKFLPKP